MKYKKKNFEKYYSIIIIFLLLLSYVTSDPDCSSCINDNGSCTGADCSSCKPKLSSPTCKLCNVPGNLYYSFDSEDVCTSETSCTNNIVFKTKECVNSCESKYSMGDFCYYQCPENSVSDSSNTCKCSYNYYIESIGGKNQITCLAQNNECPPPYNYYDFDTKECKTVTGTNYLTECSKKIKIGAKSNNSRIYICSNDCRMDEIHFDPYCVHKCGINQKYYFSEVGIAVCVDDCATNSKKEDGNKCVDSCTSKEENNKCVTSCQSGFVKKDNANICETDASNCYSIQGDTSTDKICYNSCEDIPGGSYYYEHANKICSNVECDFHTVDATVKKCYDSLEICYTNGYKYFNDKRCLAECNNFIKGDEPDGYPIECFDNQIACRNKGLYFYTTDPKACYSDCPAGLYPNENDSDGHPTQDDNGNTCSDSNCNSNFPKFSNGICKQYCDDDECYYIGQNVCKLKANEPFYYKNADNKFICVSSCLLASKYNFDGEKECADKCKSKIDNTKFVYYDSSNICKETCNKYAESPDDDHKLCQDTCPIGSFYYVNGESKIIINRCYKLISKDDNQKCVDQCDANEKSGW